MLQNEPTTQPPTPTGQNRVTPEELSRALAALEGRKQAEAQRLAGTIPIEEAVTQLHLDATPDEIWAEVQAQRNKPAADSKTFAEADAARRAQSAQEYPAHTPAQANLSAQSGGRRWRGIRVIAPLLFVWFLFHNGIIPHFGGHAPHAAAPILRPLAQIPDGKEVFADDSALVQLSEGKSPAQVTVSENVDGNRWTLVKIGGHVYLRAFVAYTDSLQTLQGKALKVTNDDDAGELRGERTSNVTLRVDKIPLQKSGGDDGYSEVTVPNFQPDPLTTLSPWH